MKEGLCEYCGNPISWKYKPRKFCNNNCKNTYMKVKYKEKNGMSIQKARSIQKKSVGLCHDCPEPVVIGKTLCDIHLHQKRISSRRQQESLRIRILSNYGNCCSCCGDKQAEFLAIDHINGGGNKHRKSLKVTGYGFYRWLKKNNFPKEFRILCHNCNFSLGHYGYCPHEKEKPGQLTLHLVS